VAIIIIYHEEPDGFWAESPDAPGFTAVAPTREELDRRVEEGIQFYFENASASTPMSGAAVDSTFKVLVEA
jgi:predicted RNase H-like HicB family nuclease